MQATAITVIQIAMLPVVFIFEAKNNNDKNTKNILNTKYFESKIFIL
jgi:hypothetical protein